jgi:hypothetical protein
MKTKLLALTYSAWSEAQFSQIIYTPYAFRESEINEIQRVRKSGITAGWKRLIKISINKINVSDSIRNTKKSQLNHYIDIYIFKQSQIRNKIAHGEWINVLEDDEAKATDFNQRLDSLNVVDIMIEFQVHTTIGKIIRDLVQSPNNGFSQNYDNHIIELEDYLLEASSWTIESKKARLLENPKKIICSNCKNII